MQSDLKIREVVVLIEVVEQRERIMRVDFCIEIIMDRGEGLQKMSWYK